METKEQFSRNTGQTIYTVKQPRWMTSGDYILPSARTAITGGGDPMSYWRLLINSVKEDKNAVVENDMWELVDCPKNVKVINKCWVLRMKLTANGFMLDRS